MKTIIYYRKSTDRDDKQANSLEHQLENCLRVAKKYNYEVVEKIGESRSAKTEFTRPGFNELIDICKKGKIDFIIIDEPKRLSRNNIDTSRIIDLLDKKMIKGVLGTSREYKGDNSRDKFLLQLDLSLSKMDNEDRSKDVKDKMQTCVNNTRRFLGKAPFGYRNITIKKGHKEITVDKKEAKIVREIFNLRVENKAFNTIGLILEEKYGTRINLNYRASRIKKLVNKTFYYGVFSWNGKEIIGSHEPIISKEVFDKANGITKGIHEKLETIKKNPRKYRKYQLKGFIKDTSGILLTGYTQKGISYYGNQYRSEVNVCINEEKLFDKIGDIIKKFELQNIKLKDIDKDIILELLRKEEINNGNEFFDIDLQVKELEKKQEDLLDMKLDGKVNEEMYLLKNNKIENEIQGLKEDKKNIKNNDYEEKTQIMLELAGRFSTSYFGGTKEVKVEIIKKLMLELFINNKKELVIEESPIFKSSEMLSFPFGTPKGNGTPVWTVRGSRPSH